MILKINLKWTSFFLFLLLSNISFGKMKIEDLFKEKSEMEDPMALRDPFLAPHIGIEKERRERAKGRRTNFSNIPEIGEVKLSDLIITGVVIGPQRRAFAHIMLGANPSQETYVLKEGMRLGENRAELKAILPGGLVFVEKNTNIYGEDEYLETVIPISK